MKRLLIILTVMLLPTAVFAQTGGPVTVGAIDSSSGATEPKVGDATNHAIRVNVVAGSSGNAAASATGSAVPASASYGGLNVAGTLRGQTGSNPSGVVYAANSDITSIGGTTVVTGNGTAAGALRVALPTDGTGVVVLGAGTALAGKFGIDQTTPGTTNAVSLSHIGSTAVASGNGVVGAGVQRVVIASDNTAFTVNAAESGTWTVQPGNTANTTPWLVKAGPYDGCGTTTYDPAAVKIADATLDVLTATTTCVETIVLTNISAASATITVQDTQGTPVELLKALTISPNQTVTLNNLGGLKFASGIKYQASIANAFNIWVKGRQ